jgi:hypothetical protein
MKLITHLHLVPTLRLGEDIYSTNPHLHGVRKDNFTAPLRRRQTSWSWVKACDTPLNIFGIPHGYSIQTSVSQPGLIRTLLGVPREIVEQINILKYHQKFQIALKISRKLVSGYWQ